MQNENSRSYVPPVVVPGASEGDDNASAASPDVVKAEPLTVEPSTTSSSFVPSVKQREFTALTKIDVRHIFYRKKSIAFFVLLFLTLHL